jgi:hypothetical protein
MPKSTKKFHDLKIAIVIKLVVLSLLIFYVRNHRIHLSFNQIDQHLTK